MKNPSPIIHCGLEYTPTQTAARFALLFSFFSDMLKHIANGKGTITHCRYALANGFLLAVLLSASQQLNAQQCDLNCSNVTLVTIPAPTCNLNSFQIGGAEHGSITFTSNTYYDFDWTEGSNTNGYCATPDPIAAANPWWSGATTTITITANRSNCTSLGTSAVLAYRISPPPTAANPTGGGTYCVGDQVTLNMGTNPPGNWQYHWVDNPNSENSLGTNATYIISSATVGTTTYYVRSKNGICWGTASSGITVTVPNLSHPTLQSITNPSP